MHGQQNIKISNGNVVNESGEKIDLVTELQNSG